MKVFVCIDDKKGMLFNHRRQSRDKKVIEKMYEIIGDQSLWIHSFSEKLLTERVNVTDTFLEEAGEDTYCFVENQPLAPYIEKIDTVYLFHWNRQYPSDVTFDLDLTAFTLTKTEEFAGNSHEKITMEVWKK